MADRDVNIGLSLGADVCWPICYENLFKDLKLDGMTLNGEELRFFLRARDHRAIQPASTGQV